MHIEKGSEIYYLNQVYILAIINAVYIEHWFAWRTQTILNLMLEIKSHHIKSLFIVLNGLLVSLVFFELLKELLFGLDKHYKFC